MRFSRSSCVMEILKPAKQYCRMPVAYRRYYNTAGGIEKDSAFSYPKPQLLLTKPKLFVPKVDKKLPKVDINLPIIKPPLCGLAFRRPRSKRIRSQLSRIRGSKTYLYNQFPYARKISHKSKKGKPSPSPSNRKGRRLNCFRRYFPVLDRGEIIRNNQLPKG